MRVAVGSPNYKGEGVEGRDHFVVSDRSTVVRNVAMVAVGVACLSALAYSPELVELCVATWSLLQISLNKLLEEEALSAGAVAVATAAESVTPAAAGSAVLAIAQGAVQLALANPLPAIMTLCLAGASVQGANAEITNTKPFPNQVFEPGSEINLDIDCKEYFSGYQGDVFCQVDKGSASELTTSGTIARYDAAGSARGVHVDGGVAYVSNFNAGVTVLNISDVRNMMRIGGYDTANAARDVALSGNTLCVADTSSGVVFFDAADPTNLQLLGSYDTPGFAFGVLTSGSTAFVGDLISVEIVDFSNPASPAQLSSISEPAFGTALSGNTLFIAAGEIRGLVSVDVSNPASPSALDNLVTDGSVKGVAVSSTNIAVADGAAGFKLVDASNPSALSLVGSLDTPGSATYLTVNGNFAYVADESGGLQIIDFSTPALPKLVGAYPTAADADAVALYQSYVLVGGGSDTGLLVVDTSQIQLGGTPDSNNVGIHKIGLQARDGQGGFAQLQFTATIDSVPIVALPPAQQSVTPPGKLEMIVQADLTFLDSDGHFLDIKVTNEDGSAAPSWLEAKKRPAFKVGSYAVSGTSRIRAVVVKGTVAYAVRTSGSDGIMALNVNTPENPTLLGSKAIAGIYDIAVSGSTIYAAASNSIEILDASDPSGIADLGSDATPLSTEYYDVALLDDTHILVSAGSTSSGGLDAIRVFDVSVPASPSIVSTTPLSVRPYQISVFEGVATISMATHGIQFADVSSPASPQLMFLHDGGDVKDTHLTASFVYVADQDDFQVLGWNATMAWPVSEYRVDGITAVTVERNTAFVSCTVGAMVFDVTDRTTPVLLDTYRAPAQGLDILVDNKLLYISDGTAGLQIANRNANIRITGSPLAADAGNYRFKLTATDPLEESASAELDVRVEGPPELENTPAPWRAKVGKQFTRFVPGNTFRDPNNDVPRLAAADDPLAFNPASGTFIGEFTEAHVGRQWLVVNASDGILPSVATARIAVDVDRSPVVLLPLKDIVVKFNASNVYGPGNGFNVAGAFSDADNNPLSFTSSLSNGQALPPSKLNFNSTDLTLRADFTDLADVRTWELRVTADDGQEGVVSDNFRLIVTQFPEPNGALPQIVAVVGRPLSGVSVTNYFVDPANGELTFAARLNVNDPLPRWLSFVGGAYSGTPSASDLVLDGGSGELVSQELSVEARNVDGGAITRKQSLFVDRAPRVANQVGNQIFDLGAPVNVDMSTAFADDDVGHSVSLSASRSPEGPMPAGLSFAGNRILGAVNVTSNVVVRVTATDPLGATEYDDVAFAFIRFPSGVNLPQAIGEVGKSFSADWSGACISNNGELLSYSVSGAPSNFEMNAGSGAVTWPKDGSALSDAQIGTHAMTIECRVPSGGSAQASASVLVVRKPSVRTALPAVSYVNLGAFSLVYPTPFQDDQALNVSLSSAHGLSVTMQGDDAHVTGNLPNEGVVDFTLDAIDPDGYAAYADGRVDALPFPEKLGNVPQQVVEVGDPNRPLNLDLSAYLRARSLRYPASYTLSMLDGSAVPGWLSVAQATGQMSGVPPLSQTDLPNVVATVAYPVGGLTAQANFTVIAQYAPTSSTISDQIANLNAPFEFTQDGVFADRDGINTLSFGHTGAASWMTVSITNTGTVRLRITGTPDVAAASTVVLVATDNYGKQATTSLLVDAFSFPTVSNITALQARTGVVYERDLSAEFQSNGQGALSFSLDHAGGLPQGMSFNGGLLRWTPTNDQRGDYELTVHGVSNSGASVSDRFLLEAVQHPSVRDLVNANQIANVNAPYNYFIANPFEGDGPIAVSVVSDPAASWLQIASTPGNTTLYGMPPAERDYTLTLWGTDGRGNRASQQMALSAFPYSEVVGTVGDQLINVGDERVVELSEVLRNPSTRPGAYSIMLQGGLTPPGWLNNLNAQTGTLRMRPPSAEVSLPRVVVTYTITGTGVSSSADFGVIAEPFPTVANSVSSQITNWNTPYAKQFAGLFAYWNGVTQLSLSVNGLPSWASYNVSTASGSAILNLWGTPTSNTDSVVQVMAAGPYSATVAQSFSLKSRRFPTPNPAEAAEALVEAGQEFTTDASNFFTVHGNEQVTYSIDDSAFIINANTGQVRLQTSLADLGRKPFTVSIRTAEGAVVSQVSAVEVAQFPTINEAVLASQDANTNVPYRYFIAHPFTDDGPLTITLVVDPPAPWLQMSSQPGNVTLYGTPTLEARYAVSLRGTDAGGASQTQTYSLYARPYPVARGSIAAIVVDSDGNNVARFSLSTVLDNPASGVTASYTLLQSGGHPLPSGMSFSGVTGDAAWDPSTTDHGVYHLDGKLITSAGNEAQTHVQVTVGAFPKAGDTPARIVADLDQPFAAQRRRLFTDANGVGTLNVTASGLPAWANMSTTVDNGELVVTFAGAPSSPASQTVIVRASDGLAAVEQNVPLIAIAFPTLTSPFTQQVIPAGQLLDIDLSSNVNRGGSSSVNFALAEGAVLPNGATLGASGRLQWRPSDAQASPTPVELPIDVRSASVPEARLRIAPRYVVARFPTVADRFVTDQVANLNTPYRATVANPFADDGVVTVTHRVVPSADNPILGAGSDGNWLQMLSRPGNTTLYGTPTFEQRWVITITGTDTGGANATQVIRLYTLPYPEASGSLSRQLVNVGTLMQVDLGSVLVSRARGTGVTYSLLQQGGQPVPSSVSVNSVTGLIGWRPGETDTGSHLFSGFITNGEDVSARTALDVDVDHFPVAGEIPDQYVDVNTDVDLLFSNRITDQDGANTLSFSVAGVPSWANITATVNSNDVVDIRVVGRPTTASESLVAVTGTDSYGAIAVVSFNVESYEFTQMLGLVAGTGAVPQLPAQMAGVGVPFEFSVGSHFNSPTGLTLRYESSGRPPWLNMDAATGRFSGTPQPSDVLVSDVLVSSVDSRGQVRTAGFPLDTQYYPVVARPPAPWGVRVGQTATRILPADTCTDANPGDAVSYLADPAHTLPTAISFDGPTRTATANFAGAEQVVLHLSCTDGRKSVPFRWTVNAIANSLPTQVGELPVLEATVGTRFSWSIESNLFHDANDDLLTFSASGLPDFLSMNNGTALSGTPTTADGSFMKSTDITFTLHVDDGTGNTPVTMRMKLTGPNAFRWWVDFFLEWGTAPSLLYAAWRYHHIPRNFIVQNCCLRDINDGVKTAYVGEHFSAELRVKRPKVGRVVRVIHRPRHFFGMCCNVEDFIKLVCGLGLFRKMPKFCWRREVERDIADDVPWLSLPTAMRALVGTPTRDDRTVGVDGSVHRSMARSGRVRRLKKRMEIQRNGVSNDEGELVDDPILIRVYDDRKYLVQIMLVSVLLSKGGRTDRELAALVSGSGWGASQQDVKGGLEMTRVNPMAARRDDAALRGLPTAMARRAHELAAAAQNESDGAGGAEDQRRTLSSSASAAVFAAAGRAKSTVSARRGSGAVVGGKSRRASGAPAAPSKAIPPNTSVRPAEPSAASSAASASPPPMGRGERASRHGGVTGVPGIRGIGAVPPPPPPMPGPGSGATVLAPGSGSGRISPSASGSAAV